MNEEHRQRHDHRFAGFGFLAVLVVYSFALLAGYGITTVIYHFTGRLPEILEHVLSGLIGLLFLILVVGLFTFLREHVNRDHHQNTHNILTDALKQISQGNFNILLDAKKSDIHHEFAEAINDMAKNLGNLETMREDFISNVSHEIQSPLTSISGFAALLQMNGLSEEQRNRYARIIEAESKRLSSLSDNLLKLSSLDNNKVPLSKKEFRLDKQLERVALTLEPQWSAKGLTLEADLVKCSVLGDEDLLSQVWVNLLHNAIKFTPEGGQICIVLSIESDEAVVRISDTGIGITPEDQIHVFERFYKADKARDRSLGGNGLGLSLVKKIVELHGGQISVESTVGKGTIFIARLVQK
jgi:signal transduction histidine kinase